MAALVTAVVVTNAAAAQTALNKYGNPEKHAPRATSQAINSEDLKTRLYIFADDSMEGRQFGRIGNMKGTNYIAGEVKRLGLRPAGDNGTYFQRLPMIQRHFTDKSTMTADGTPLHFNVDFVPLPTARAPKPFQSAQVIFGGNAGDTAGMITGDQAAGKFVILLPSVAPAAGGRGGRGGFGGAPSCANLLNPSAVNTNGGRGGFGGFGGFGSANPAARFPNAAAVATVDLDMIPLGGSRLPEHAHGATPTHTADRSARGGDREEWADRDTAKRPSRWWSPACGHQRLAGAANDGFASRRFPLAHVEIGDIGRA
jgi:hypothetical protein